MRISTLPRIVVCGLVCGALVATPAVAFADTFPLDDLMGFADAAKAYASLVAKSDAKLPDAKQWGGLWTSTLEFFGTSPMTASEVTKSFPELSRDLKAELADLYGKVAKDLEAGVEPDEIVYARIQDILQIARTKRLKKALGSKRFREYENLVAEFDALPEGHYLSHAKFARLLELESQDPMNDDDHDPIEEDVIEMEGLTDAEKKELIDIYYREYQDYRRGTPINEADWTRHSELTLKSDLAHARKQLSDAEYAEYEDLSIRFATDEGLSDEETDRMVELIIKIGDD